MAKLEQQNFVLPKRRNGKKSHFPGNHVDHILSIQGAKDETEKKKNGLSPVSENFSNGIIHFTMEGLKSNMKINLPIINDVNDEEYTPNCDEKVFCSDNIKPYHSVSNNSKELHDLSPIYENSSDACSSHDDLRENSDIQKICKTLNSDQIESSSTPNSLSQTQSETSLEMGLLTDSLKNSCKRKKRVNIVQDIIETDNTDTETTALRKKSHDSASPDWSLAESSKDCYLTMTGTIKRGKKKGQNVDVKLNISREELEILEASIMADGLGKIDVSKCSLYYGPHIFLFSIMCMPAVALISALYTFYMGTITWYNIFTHITENTKFIKKIFLAPIVILTYPFLIFIFTAGVGFYAAFVQVTFNGRVWWKTVCDFEKGFYGWFCNKIGYSMCSPYEVVVLVDIKP